MKTINYERAIWAAITFGGLFTVVCTIIGACH